MAGGRRASTRNEVDDGGTARDPAMTRPSASPENSNPNKRAHEGSARSRSASSVPQPDTGIAGTSRNGPASLTLPHESEESDEDDGMPRRKRLRRSRQEPAANAATPGNGPPPQPQRTTRHSARLSARAQVDDGANNHPENANGLTSQPSTDQSSSPNENESTEAPADSSDPTSSAPSEGPSPDKPADEDGETQSLRSGTHTPPNDAIVDDARSDNAVANASDESENDQLSQVNDVSNEDADKDSPQEGINTPPPEPTSRATSQAATRATSQLPDASSNLAVPGTESATQSRLVTPVPDTGGIVTPTSVPAQTSRRGNGTRGRQRGGRRGGPARGNGNGRGRYTRNGRGRGGRLQPIEADQPTTSSPFFRGLRERQKELERSFRRVGNAHRGALATLATRWEELLAKDPRAHMELPGWKNVCDELDRRLNDRLEVVRAERNYRLQEANTLCAAEKNRLETKLGYQCAHVQREYLMAVMGDCIAQCEKIAKGDEDKSEDQSEAESENDSPEDTDPNKDNAAPASENEFRLPVKRTFVRGWNSTGCSEVENAALIDRALYQWGEMMEWVKHPEKVQESLESRKAEVVSREATVANAKTEGEVSQGKDKTLFNMLAQVCGDELQTVTTAEGNLSTLATVAAGEGKPDSGKTKASDETLIEEERIEEFTTINNRQAEREAADVEAFRRRAAEESAEREKADRERLRTLEPPPFRPPPPIHPSHEPIPPQHPRLIYPTAPIYPPQPLMPPTPHYRSSAPLAPPRSMEESRHYLPYAPTPYAQYPYPPQQPLPPPPMHAQSNPTQPHEQQPHSFMPNTHQRVLLPQPGSSTPLAHSGTFHAPPPPPPQHPHANPLASVPPPPPAQHPNPFGPPPPPMHPSIAAYPPQSHVSPRHAPPVPYESERMLSPMQHRRILPAFSPSQSQQRSASASILPPPSSQSMAPPAPIHPQMAERYPRHEPHYRYASPIPPPPLPPHPHGMPPPAMYPPTLYGPPPHPSELLRHPMSGRATQPPEYSSPYARDPNAFYPQNPYHRPPVPEMYYPREHPTRPGDERAPPLASAPLGPQYARPPYPPYPMADPSAMRRGSRDDGSMTRPH